MNLKTIKEIQTSQVYPSITITLPTHRTSPDNDKDTIRLKNLVSEAINRLESEFGKREVAEEIKKIEQIASEIDHEYNLDGLVIFVNKEFDKVFKLPFRLPERVTIADNFLTRDLVFAMNRSPRYLLTVLSQHGTQLFLGRKDYLEEIQEYGFPFSLENTTAEASPSQDISHVRDQLILDQMTDVGEALQTAQQALDAPIVIAGVDRNVGHFKEGARIDEKYILHFIRAGLDTDNLHELGKRIWTEIRETLATTREQVFTDLEVAKSNKVFVGGLNEVWQAAIDGRIELLVIEENLHIPAQISEDGRKVIPMTDSSHDTNHPQFYDDILDEMIEHVIQTNGKVRFVDDGRLQENNPVGIAAITRY